MKLKLLILWLISLGVIAHAADRTEIKNACTERETWSFSGMIPKSSRNRLDDIFSIATKKNPSLKKALGAMDDAVLLVKDRDAQVKLLAGYGMARLYYTMGYPHLARRLIETLIRRDKPKVGERSTNLALLSCLNELHRRSAAITNDMALLETLELWSKGASAEELEAIQEAEFHLFQQELRAKKTVSLTLFGALQKEGSWGNLAQGVSAIQNGELKAGISKLKKFLKGPKSPVVTTSTDLAKLLLARAFAETGDRSKAEAILRSIPPVSPLISEAITDRGELLSKAGKYSRAADVLMNLQLGPMAYTFEPEGQVELARSLAKLCQYPAAFRVLGTFSERYSPVKQTLESYLSPNSTATLYGRLKSFLDTPEASALADRIIALEWIRSGQFIASQQEINMILAEKEASLRHESEIRDLGGKTAAGYGAKVFLSSLKKFRASLEEREKLLVGNMERELKAATMRMQMKLARAEERAVLLDADVMRLAGADLAQAKQDLVTKKEEKQTSTAPNLLNWGRVPATELEKHEVWADEFGSLKALIANNCHG